MTHTQILPPPIGYYMLRDDECPKCKAPGSLRTIVEMRARLTAPDRTLRLDMTTSKMIRLAIDDTPPVLLTCSNCPLEIRGMWEDVDHVIFPLPPEVAAAMGG